MPSNLLFALILLVLIYTIAILHAALANTRTAIATALIGIIVLIFIVASHACLTTGGCYLMAWIYVFIYLAVLLTIIFATALVMCARYKSPAMSWVNSRLDFSSGGTADSNVEGGGGDGIDHDGDHDQGHVNENISLDQSGDGTDFLKRRQERIRNMLENN